MALPTHQAVGTAVNSTGGALTVNYPAHQVGDVALLIVESAGGSSISLSNANGFSEVINSPQTTATGTSGTRLAVFWCRATSSSMPSPIISATTDHLYGVIITARGCVSTGNPVDSSAGAIKSTASTSLTLPAITTNTVDTLIYLIATRDNDSSSTAFSNWTNANLVSVTERFDNGTTSGNGGGIGVASGGRTAIGNIGTSTATVTSSQNAMMTIALASVGATEFDRKKSSLFLTF